MGKLFGLKGWWPVAEVARHLATVIKEAVSEADVLRLVLDGQLRLSVYFVNSTIARTGRVIAIDKATGEPAWPTEVIRGLTLNTGEGIVFDGDVVPVTGVWDLPMIDGERIEVEQRYQHLIDGPAVTRIAFNGTFVEGKDGQICQLQEDGDENEFLHPAGGLPKDSLLVVRTEALIDFQQSISDARANLDKPLSTKERESLLKLVLGMAIKGYGYKPAELRNAATSEICKDLGTLGVGLDPDTVRKFLHEASEMLTKNQTKP